MNTKGGMGFTMSSDRWREDRGPWNYFEFRPFRANRAINVFLREKSFSQRTIKSSGSPSTAHPRPRNKLLSLVKFLIGNLLKWISEEIPRHTVHFLRSPVGRVSINFFFIAKASDRETDKEGLALKSKALPFTPQRIIPLLTTPPSLTANFNLNLIFPCYFHSCKFRLHPCFGRGFDPK
ncbi:hypothetical protein CEXT_172031 [Caerostris extrusa]|uniref:Uncharacterized protein n=1 Tax=Caerostris extrusa TaxID=172846 RepID=A0AAV4YCW0_CAEEX|nr:hypothetical protein CEXT_172031 [Caerostris extrusa]